MFHKNNKGVFMKKTEKIFGLTLAVLFALALIACSNGSTGGSKPPAAETPTARTSGTEKALSFGGKITIKSDDKFTNAEWTAACDKVVAAIMRGYNKNMGSDPLNLSNKGKFEAVFATEKNVAIVLSSSAAYNCEVKSGDYTTIYLKTSAIDTVDIQPAMVVLDNGTGAHTS
jgi:hypothetical protein